jgi:hypothetical protein
MNNAILRTLAWSMLGLAATTGAAQADAVITSMRGDARMGNAAVALNQRIYSGSTLHTGPGAQVVLKFDDGQQIVLNETTTFKITDFRYRAAEPRNDRAVFDLLQGALRFITGIVGSRSRDSVQLRIPQATIGIRGTDFMVALVNPAYFNVVQGAIASSNAAGTVVFGAGTVGTVGSASSLALTMPASALPGAVTGAFSNLAAAQVAAAGAAGAAGGAGGASGAAAAAAPVGGAAGVAVGLGVAAGVIGISSSDDNSTVLPATTHH